MKQAVKLTLPIPELSPSPFLPGTNVQYAWDSTSIGMFKRCPRLYQLTMIEGYQESDQSPHLRFGIEYHQSLQEYDVARFNGLSHDDAVRVILRALLTRTYGWQSDHERKNRDFLVRTVLWYLDKFKDDPAKTFKMDNGKPAVEVSFKFELDWGPNTYVDGDEIDIRAGALHYADGTKVPNSQPYLLCGHLDRIVEFENSLFVMDRKTTTTTPSEYYFNQYSPDNQMSLYSFAAQVVVHSPVKGVILDVAQVAAGFSRYVRGMTYRTVEQVQEWVEDLHHWFSLAEHYATVGHWPMNDTACDKYGGCKFREICSKSPRVRDKFLKSNFKQASLEERWNPLKPRE